jgi:hypothetical protein
MNSALVKSAPQGEFVEVSAPMDSWETRFQTLVSQKQPIRFDMYPKHNIPPDITDLLRQQGYKQLTLANDRWQHFLIPNPIETPQAAT